MTMADKNRNGTRDRNKKNTNQKKISCFHKLHIKITIFIRVRSTNIRTAEVCVTNEYTKDTYVFLSLRTRH